MTDNGTPTLAFYFWLLRGKLMWNWTATSSKISYFPYYPRFLHFSPFFFFLIILIFTFVWARSFMTVSANFMALSLVPTLSLALLCFIELLIGLDLYDCLFHCISGIPLTHLALCLLQSNSSSTISLMNFSDDLSSPLCLCMVTWRVNVVHVSGFLVRDWWKSPFSLRMVSEQTHFVFF